MNPRISRRDVLQSATVGSSLAMAISAGLDGLPATGAESVHRSDSEIAKLAERIMETAPENIVEMIVGEMKRGLSPKQLLAAEYNAGIRFQGHHSGYVAHPIEVVGRSVPQSFQLLPLFYYLSVLRFRAKRNTLRWVDESKLPMAAKAKEFFHAAMQEGDRDDALRAAVAMSRDQGAKNAFEELWIYGAERNAGSGGHTAISVINSYRTMNATDWQCAESAIRFAVEDSFRPPRDAELCELNRQRIDRAKELPNQWSTTKSDEGATIELVKDFRRGRPGPSCRRVFDALRSGEVSADSVWDAVFLTTAELVMRYQWVGAKMLAGHSVTCTNALHYMYRMLKDPGKRLFAVLESVHWTTSFLARERNRPALRDRDIFAIEPGNVSKDDEFPEAVYSLLPPRRFASMTRLGLGDVDKAMELTFGWATRHQDRTLFIDTALQLMCVKSTEEVHDFKFPMALFENCQFVSERWKPHLLASSVHLLHGTAMEDSRIVNEAKDIVETIR